MVRKSISLLVAITFLITGACLAYDQIDSIVLVQATPEDHALLRSLQAEIDAVRPDGWVVLYIPQENLSLLTQAGFIYQVLYQDSRDTCNWIVPTPGLEASDTHKIDFTSYHDHDELVAALEELHANYPEITELYYLGDSVEGRSIDVLVITDNPSIEEIEPEIRLLGAHHGNERIGVEVPLYFADYLCSNYATDSRVQDIVDNTEVWICPMVNPDGVEHGWRRNAHNVDINRNYSYMWDPSEEPYCGPYPFSEPETQAVRRFSTINNNLPDYFNNTFVISHSFHSGAECINFVWNYGDAEHPSGTDHPTPDDDVIEDVAYGYWDAYTGPKSDPWTYGFGVTNGCDWYATWGDTNDWSYGERSDNDYTIELSNNYSPPPSTILTYCGYNLESLLYTCEVPLTVGIMGVVLSGYTEEPLLANIDVDDRDWPWYTDPQMGDFYRQLLPGSYDVTVSSEGFASAYFDDVVVNEGTITNLGYIWLSYNTDIELMEFCAKSHPEGISLSWRVTDDEEATGYNLYRSKVEQAPTGVDSYNTTPLSPNHVFGWQKLNDAPIIGQNPYSFLDNEVQAGLRYSYKLEAICDQELVSLGTASATAGKPGSFALSQNYPNPATSATTINFTLSNPSPATSTLAIYDLSGRLVTTLVDDILDAGDYQACWDLRSDDGEKVASGVYVYRLTSGIEQESRRMVVVR